MGAFAISHSLYIPALLLYFAGWIIALAGLSAAQHSCAESTSEFVRLTSSTGVFAPTTGANCSKLFRFAWFILWLGVLPLLVEIAALSAKAVSRNSKSSAGWGAPLFAVIAVFYILVTNAFYNAVDTGGAFAFASDSSNDGIGHTTKMRLRCALAGFAIAAAAALLLMLLAPFTIASAFADSNNTSYDARSTTTTQSDKRGGVVPPTTTQAAGTGHPPQVVVA